MKTRENLKLFTLSGVLLSLSAQVCANPEFAIDYEWSSANGIEFSNDTLLVKPVNMTCPADGDPDNIAGYLVATASALFNQLPGGGDISVLYYLKKNNEDPQDHQYSYSPGIHQEIAPAIQRVDQCIEGETVSYGFGAKADEFSGSRVTADKPRLVVKFIRDQLPE